MPSLKLSSRERVEVYRRLFLLNRSFTRITQLLDELTQSPIFKARDLREMRGLAEKVQLEINTVLLNLLELAEQNEHAQLGKIRISNENEAQWRASKSNVQASPQVPGLLFVIVCALIVLLVFASLRVNQGVDWIYHSQDGMPAPCPPPNRGYFPRDCH